jgi:hypothetical protein
MDGTFVFERKRSNDTWEEINDLPLTRLRGCFSQEGEVLVLFGHLPTQPQQLGPFSCAERLVGTRLERLHPPPFVSDPHAQRILDN